MLKDLLAEEQKNENEDEMKDEAKVEASEACEYETPVPAEGNRARIDNASDTSGLPGLVDWRRKKITKKFPIDNEEELVEIERWHPTEALCPRANVSLMVKVVY